MGQTELRELRCHKAEVQWQVQVIILCMFLFFCIVPLISYRYLLLCIIEISIIKALQGFGCDGKATAEQKMNVIP